MNTSPIGAWGIVYAALKTVLISSLLQTVKAQNSTTTYATSILAIEPNWVYIVCGVIVILLSLFFLILGGKGATYVVGFFAFLLGFMLSMPIYNFIASKITQTPDPAIALYVSLAIGILLTVLAVCFASLGVFLTGCAMGYMVALFVLGYLKTDGQTSMIVLICVTVAGGILAIIFKKWVFAIFGSVIGAILFFIGIDFFTRFGLAAQAITSIQPYIENNRKSNEAGIFSFLALTIILAVIAMVFHFKLSGRKKKKSSSRTNLSKKSSSTNQLPKK